MREMIDLAMTRVWRSLGVSLYLVFAIVAWNQPAHAGGGLGAQDLVGVHLGMSIDEVETVLRDKHAIEIDRIKRAVPSSAPDTPRKEYVQRIVAKLQEDKTLSIVFSSPLTQVRAVEILLTDHSPTRPAKDILADVTARFGKPTSQRWIKRDSQVIAAWGGLIGSEGELVPSKDARVAARLEVIPGVSSEVTLYAAAASRDDNARIRTARQRSATDKP